MDLLADNTFQKIFSKAWEEWKVKQPQNSGGSMSTPATPSFAGTFSSPGSTMASPFAGTYSSTVTTSTQATLFPGTFSSTGSTTTASTANIFGGTFSSTGSTPKAISVFGKTSGFGEKAGFGDGATYSTTKISTASTVNSSTPSTSNVYTFEKIKPSTSLKKRQKTVFGGDATLSPTEDTEIPAQIDTSEKVNDRDEIINISSLFNNRRYEECIKCIEYLNNFWMCKRYVEYLIKSYVAINDFHSAKSVADMFIQNQKNDKNKDDAKIWSDPMLNQIKNQQLCLVENFSIPDLKLTGPRFSNISGKINLRHCEKKGYAMIATEKIEVGEIILYEEPYASVGRAKCAHCFLDTFLRISCSTCNGLYYCTKQCKEDDMKSHKWICKFLKKNPSIKATVTLALSVFLNGLKMDFKNVLEEMKFLEPANNFANFILLSEFFKNESNLLDKLVKDSCYLTSYIINKPNVFEYIETLFCETAMSTNDIINLVGQTLLRLLVVCENKSFIIFDDVLEKTTEMFPFLSLLQNNCEPNTIICRVQNKIILRALKDIQLGESITCSYFEMMNTTYRNILFDNASLCLLNERCSNGCHCLKELHKPLDNKSMYIGANNNGDISNGLFVAQLQMKISKIRNCLSNKNIWNVETAFKLVKEINLNTNHLIYQLTCFEVIELKIYSEKLDGLEIYFPTIMNIDNVQFFKKNHIQLYLILKQKVSLLMFNNYSEPLLNALIAYIDFLKWFVKTSYPNQVMLNDVEKMYTFYRRLAVYTNDNGLLNALEA